jgi:hypothetical protein
MSGKSEFAPMLDGPLIDEDALWRQAGNDVRLYNWMYSLENVKLRSVAVGRDVLTLTGHINELRSLIDSYQPVSSIPTTVFRHREAVRYLNVSPDF